MPGTLVLLSPDPYPTKHGTAGIKQELKHKLSVEALTAVKFRFSRMNFKTGINISVFTFSWQL